MEMNYLNIGFSEYNTQSAIADVSFFLDSISSNLMGQIPWVKYSYHPEVYFTMGYGSDCIFLKYYVSETSIQAANGTINGAVYQDSCVEFFISFAGEKSYYNFEFNCIGTARVGYGENRDDRQLLHTDLIKQIKYQSVINNQPKNEIHWEEHTAS